jgi:hypothetical protein
VRSNLGRKGLGFRGKWDLKGCALKPGEEGGQNMGGRAKTMVRRDAKRSSKESQNGARVLCVNFPYDVTKTTRIKESVD